MKKEAVKRKITIGNYIALSIIIILSLFAFYLSRKVYLDYQKYNMQRAFLSGTVAELSTAEIDNYITDNADALIYFGVSDDENSRAIEKQLLKLIEKDKLKEEIVYLNLTDEINKDAYIDIFNNKYMTKTNGVNNYPALVLVLERKAVASISKKDKELKFSEIEKFLDQYELVQ